MRFRSIALFLVATLMAGAGPAPAGAAESPAPEQTPSARSRRRALLSEPVRAISPGPGRRQVESAPPRVKRSPRAKLKVTPSPTAAATAQPAEAQTEAKVETEATAETEATPASVATVAAAEITGYAENPPAVQRILDQSLSLTTQNLEYKYGSADPAKGGMDCSGFVHYVLSQSGLANVPRDARDQYMWVRKAGTFQAVPAQRDDASELDALQPGDLLFWAGPYQTGPDPDVSYTMIYLGREKGTNQRLMVGAGEDRSYKGRARSGVGVFDFKVGPRRTSDEKRDPVFVGYGRIPDIDQK